MELSKDQERIVFDDVRYNNLDSFDLVLDCTPLFNEVRYDPEFLKNSVDINRKTLAVTTKNFSGSDILMMPEITKTSEVNIIGLHSFDIENLFIRSGGLYTRSAYTLNEAGQVIYGNFEEPIMIDYIDYLRNTINEESIRSIAASSCITNNRPMQPEFDDRKSLMRDYFVGSLPVIPGIHIEQSDSAEDKIGQFIEEQALERIVIKPDCGLGGLGVAFFDAEDREGAQNHVQGLWETEEIVVVEKYIDPLLVKEAGHSLKTNIRAISVGAFGDSILGELLVVRAGKSDEPINITSGAEVKSIDWLFDSMVDSGFNGKEVISKIVSYQKIIRDMGIGTFGADYILDHESNIHLLEVNIGYIGALSLIAQTKASREEVMDFFASCASSVSIPRKSTHANLELDAEIRQSKYSKLRQAVDLINEETSADSLKKLLDSYEEDMGIGILDTEVGIKILLAMSCLTSDVYSKEINSHIQEVVHKLYEIERTDAFRSMALIVIAVGIDINHDFPGLEELILDKAETDMEVYEIIADEYRWAEQQDKLQDILERQKIALAICK